MVVVNFIRLATQLWTLNPLSASLSAPKARLKFKGESWVEYWMLNVIDLVPDWDTPPARFVHNLYIRTYVCTYTQMYITGLVDLLVLRCSLLVGGHILLVLNLQHLQLPFGSGVRGLHTVELLTDLLLCLPRFCLNLLKLLKGRRGYCSQRWYYVSWHEMAGTRHWSAENKSQKK